MRAPKLRWEDYKDADGNWKASVLRADQIRAMWAERIDLERERADEETRCSATMRRVASLAALVAVARKTVAHLAYNASRSHGDDPGYVTTCALLMRLDAPGGQLAEALTKLDIIATGNGVADEPDD